MLRRKPLPRRELAKLVKLTKARGVKVVDWCVLGQPNPESVCGAIQVKPGVAGRVLGGLVKLGGLRPNLEVFPYGIPRPDWITIRFRI